MPPLQAPSPLRSFLAATLCLGLLAACQAPVDTTSEADDGSQVAAADAPAAEPEAYTNTVRWATASETDNFGYHVYRGDSEEGPFERLTEDPVPGAGNTDETHRYEFVDDTIDPHRAYFYYVEAISMGGVQSRFTPIIQAPPKLPADDVEPDGDSEEGSDSR